MMPIHPPPPPTNPFIRQLNNFMSPLEYDINRFGIKRTEIYYDIRDYIKSIYNLSKINSSDFIRELLCEFLNTDCKIRSQSTYMRLIITTGRVKEFIDFLDAKLTFYKI